MGVDMWLKEDVRNILTGVHLAHANLAQHFSDPEVRAYREGFAAALTATAASFGIPPAEVVNYQAFVTQSGVRTLLVQS